MYQQPLITISIVSHSQGCLVLRLLDDIQRYCRDFVEVLLTLNAVELFELDRGRYGFPIQVFQNDRELGFAANHNAAFKRISGSYFCVMNPDVRINNNLFPALIDCCKADKVGCVAPLVINSAGNIEKNARRFPTPASLVFRLFGYEQSVVERAVGGGPIFPDWVAGMMMLFPVEAFEAICGFDESYHLYYEDVDICARFWNAGYKVVLCPPACVTHDARRESHRNLRYLKWHLSSMARFFVRSFTGHYCSGKGSER
jgi:N-acetylglucosaminyl-diphospho-decaprenol L-rhamnosyltransferase